MRRMFASVAVATVLFITMGCNHTAGVCDCDPGPGCSCGLGHGGIVTSVTSAAAPAQKAEQLKEMPKGEKDK